MSDPQTISRPRRRTPDEEAARQAQVHKELRLSASAAMRYLTAHEPDAAREIAEETLRDLDA